MFSLLALVAVASVWDSNRELDNALARLARRHHVLAFTVARDLASRLTLLERDARRSAPELEPARARADALERLLTHLQEVQREGDLAILLHATGGGFRTADGRVLASRVLERGIETGERSAVLSREDAQRLGLPARRAVVGFAAIQDDARFPPLEVAVLSTGHYESDGYRHARLRTIVTGGGVALIVLVFGALLFRQQKRSLSLLAEVQHAALERARDTELARADRFAILAAMSTGIAHELGSPLTILVGRVEQLAGAAAADPRAARALRSMEEQIERMRAIVRGFTALARGEAPVLVPHEADRLARDAGELVRHRFERSGVELQLDLGQDLPLVLCDPPLLLQALVNLLVNACQASRAHASVCLRVGVMGEAVCFEVLDEGTGIEPRIAAQAHAPFFTTRAQVGGTGLGLAIANEIVQQHRGSLEIGGRASAPGTRAALVLPAYRERTGHDASRGLQNA